VPFGWITFDQSILNAYEGAQQRRNRARLSSKKGKISRGIDFQKLAASTTKLTTGCGSIFPSMLFVRLGI
jgi:hypothetical protein